VSLKYPPTSSDFVNQPLNIVKIYFIPLQFIFDLPFWAAKVFNKALLAVFVFRYDIILPTVLLEMMFYIELVSFS